MKITFKNLDELECQVYVNGVYAFTITRDNKEQFEKELNELEAKYRI